MLSLSLSGTAFIKMNTPPPHKCIFTYIGIVCLGPLDFFFFLICIIVHVCTSGRGKKNYNIIIGKKVHKWYATPLSFPLNMYDMLIHTFLCGLRFGTVRSYKYIHMYIWESRVAVARGNSVSDAKAPPSSILFKKNPLTQGVEFSWLPRWVGSSQLLQVWLDAVVCRSGAPGQKMPATNGWDGWCYVSYQKGRV